MSLTLKRKYDRAQTSSATDDPRNSGIKRTLKRRRTNTSARARLVDNSAEVVITDRNYPLRYHPEQARLWNHTARFRVVPAGRRSGKTELAKRFLVIKALEGTDFPDARFFAAAPTRDQAKRIYWDDLKSMIPEEFKVKTSESQLYIRLVNNSEVWVIGMDKPQRIEGSPWDGGILDEYGNMKKGAWGENVRPALSDRRGWCWLIGVPEGRNHYYQSYRKAVADTTGEWAAFHWISADILPKEEIEAAKRDLDELTYQQEYEASFVNFTGRAYYNFDEALHVKPLLYSKRAPLAFCFDFNVAPGTASVVQEQPHPEGFRDGVGNPIIVTGVIGEVWIPRGSNTVRVCRRLIHDWGTHEGRIICYGDATGGSKGSAKVKGSDWQLIKDTLATHFPLQRVAFKVPKANPRERDRVNAVNSRLSNVTGDKRLYVAPHCTHMINDLDGVVLLEGGTGEIDKSVDAELTHLSDGLGYYLWQEYPIKKVYAASGQRFWK
jgi:hypothetical protein